MLLETLFISITFFRCFLIKKLVKICVFRISFTEVVKDDT
jgi:hypothetical protein